MRDHFSAERWDQSKWFFTNMTTPCCETPQRAGDSVLRLPEHQMWNEGNCLLSRGFLARDAWVSGLWTGWDQECEGAAVGYYAGNGSFWGFVMLALTKGRVELRVHSGGQSGESFMSKGQPRWHTLTSAPWEAHWPVKTTLIRHGEEYVAMLDDQVYLTATIPEIQGDARALFKSLTWHDRYLPTYADLDWAEVEGFAPTATLRGSVRDGQGAPVAGASVHLAGFDCYFTLCDAQGRYELRDVPRGEHKVIAAAQGYAFAQEDAFCLAGQDNRRDITLQAETPENCPRPEYNLPLFDRSENGWMSLNGTWEFAFDPGERGVVEHWYSPDSKAYDKAIRVPFSWASLMGFGEEHLACGDTLHQTNTCFNNYLLTGQYAWYRRRFTVPASFPRGQRVMLHIGASSNVTYAWVDGRYLGMSSEEYSDICFDMGALEPGSEHVVAVKVFYPHHIPSHSMGKQIFWFASAPGIWQSVWIEPRQEAHLTRIHCTPELRFEGERCTRAQVRLAVEARGLDKGEVRVVIRAPGEGEEIRMALPLAQGKGEAVVSIKEPKLWQYRQGNLYTLRAELMADFHCVDKVGTYFGLRSVETRWLPGHSPQEEPDPAKQYQYVYLNNRPFYIIGVLDQGYNPFGVYTYRSYQGQGEERRGSIAYDIDRTLAYGYNLSRLHIKENEPLWYYECDRRGLPVWAEHPGNFYAVPEDPNWQSAYRRELEGMLGRMHNHPSALILSTINESWGVEGGHCRGPWENELRRRFLEESALRAKEAWPHVLICDNSGFAKTKACEIDDYHLYPNDHWEARKTWEELCEKCYPGSLYNRLNRHAKSDAVGSVRQIGSPYSVGDAVQNGSPLLVSEFLHINGIDMQTRLFEKIAGYVRMNVASHETEDSGPLTAERWERDYGYVDDRLRPLGYGMVNNMDMVVWDANRLEHVRVGQRVRLPLRTSHFAWREVQEAKLHLSVTGIDMLGGVKERIWTETRDIAFAPYRVEEQEPFMWEVPQGIRGAYVFAKVTAREETLCRNYVQLCVDDAREEDSERIIRIPPAAYTHLEGAYPWVFRAGERCALCIHGRGEVRYAFTLYKPAMGATLRLELGAREGKNAVKVTDQRLYPTSVSLYLDGEPIGTLCPKDDPSDERGLFSNAAAGGAVFNYMNLGTLGYGEQFDLEIPPALLTEGLHSLTLRCAQGGMSLYGRFTGRYGADPMLLLS